MSTNFQKQIIISKSRWIQALSPLVSEANKNAETKEDETPLFPNSFINELHSRQIKLSGDTEQEISKIATTISDRLEYVTKRKTELAEVDKQLQELETEQNDLLMQSGLSAELLDKSISDLKGFFDAKSRAESRVSELESSMPLSRKAQTKKNPNRWININKVYRTHCINKLKSFSK